MKTISGKWVADPGSVLDQRKIVAEASLKAEHIAKQKAARDKKIAIAEEKRESHRIQKRKEIEAERPVATVIQNLRDKDAIKAKSSPTTVAAATQTTDFPAPFTPAQGFALHQMFPTREETIMLAKGQVPSIVRDLDNFPPLAGGVLTIDSTSGFCKPDYLTLGGASGSMPFSGRVWVGGKKLTVPTTGTTQFLKVPLNPSLACSWVAAMPTGDQDVDAEVFDTSQTAGDIHLPGNFAG